MNQALLFMMVFLVLFWMVESFKSKTRCGYCGTVSLYPLDRDGHDDDCPHGRL